MQISTHPNKFVKKRRKVVSDMSIYYYLKLIYKRYKEKFDKLLLKFKYDTGGKGILNEGDVV